jgi:alanine dehydrogenase
MDTPILYLSQADVKALVPPLDEQIDLVAATFAALRAGRVHLPPKSGVHPRKDCVIRALPVYLEAEDVACIKWVGGYAGNRGRGLKFLNGLIILSDADSGLPVCVMDAGEVTAARTAAASALCIRDWAPPGWRKAAILGAGEQGRAHADVLRTLNSDVEIHVYDPHPERIEALGPRVRPHTDPREAVERADVVITAGPIRTSPTPIVERGLLGDQYLALPLDFDSLVAASVVQDAEVFLVDDDGQYADQRRQGRFADWPEIPHGLVAAPDEHGRAAARVVCANLGIGALDAAYASAVYGRATEADVGIPLPR